MVFSSVPIYSDHSNWHQLQQPNRQRGSVSVTDDSQLQPPPPPPPPPQGGCGSIRPGSMVDRARLAKIAQPEAGLKCPRCDSSNTKFCYFNNYSLTQPRHFCKTCRRYWTRGGALRNVPVGGGCRRNKRSKNPSSKSQIVTAEHQTGPNSIPKSTSIQSPPSYGSTDVSAYYFPQPPPQLPLMVALQNLSQCSGPNMAGFQTQVAATGGAGEADLGFQISGGADHQWRLPFLAAGHEPSYPYQNQGAEARPSSNPGFHHQIAPVKMEENQLGLHLSRQFIGISENNNQYSWGGNPWTGLSGVNSSSSTSHLL